MVIKMFDPNSLANYKGLKESVELHAPILRAHHIAYEEPRRDSDTASVSLFYEAPACFGKGQIMSFSTLHRYADALQVTQDEYLCLRFIVKGLLVD